MPVCKQDHTDTFFFFFFFFFFGGGGGGGGQCSGGESTSLSPMFQKKIISDKMIKLCISWALKVRFLFCKAQLVRTNFLCPYQMLSFYDIKSFTRALRNTDH